MLYIEKIYNKKLAKLTIIEKTDLEMLNHLSGKKRKYIKLEFRHISELNQVKRDLKHYYDKNKKLKAT